jgi:hypothetical protein
MVGPLIYFLAREAKGHGVPEVMEAVTLKSGFIRKRVVAVKSLASALSIAAGGAVGREGPIVQIASAIGSSVGQILKVSPKPHAHPGGLRHRSRNRGHLQRAPGRGDVRPGDDPGRIRHRHLQPHHHKRGDRHRGEPPFSGR